MRITLYPVSCPSDDHRTFEHIDEIGYVGDQSYMHIVTHQAGKSPRRILRVNESTVLALVIESEVETNIPDEE
jgi:hypothetical protein